MFLYILKRLLEAIPVLWVIATLTFFMLQWAPGGPFDQERALPAEIEAKLNAHYGLDQPVWDQYVAYMKKLVKGDLGPSFKYPGWTVNEILADKLPVSMELGIYALLLALIIGLGAGVLAALNPNSFWDYGPMSVAMVGICLPSFVIAPLLMLVFALQLPWFNVSGWVYAGDRVLPSLTMAIFYGAYIARLTRSSMMEVMQQDYIRTARAKGLGTFRVAMVHGFRNGLGPVISYLGPAMAGLISGSFVIETIFHIPGMGRFFVQAAFNRDYTLVLGTVLCYAAAIVLFNLMADIVLAWINPRQKFK